MFGVTDVNVDQGSSHFGEPCVSSRRLRRLRGFSNHLLVGNFSFRHSEIKRLRSDEREFPWHDPHRYRRRSPGGLWTIAFGVGGSSGNPDTLYFSDGINGEADGLIGAIFRKQGP